MFWERPGYQFDGYAFLLTFSGHEPVLCRSSKPVIDFVQLPPGYEAAAIKDVRLGLSADRLDQVHDHGKVLTHDLTYFSPGSTAA